MSHLLLLMPRASFWPQGQHPVSIETNDSCLTCIWPPNNCKNPYHCNQSCLAACTSISFCSNSGSRPASAPHPACISFKILSDLCLFFRPNRFNENLRAALPCLLVWMLVHILARILCACATKVPCLVQRLRHLCDGHPVRWRGAPGGISIAERTYLFGS